MSRLAQKVTSTGARQISAPFDKLLEKPKVMPTRALLVIDMQNDLCRDLRRRDAVQDMLRPLLRTIEGFAKSDQLIIYMRFALPPDDPQFERFGDRYCIDGTEGAELIEELLPLRGQVIDKSKHSAFFETPLDDILRSKGVTEVYLAGLQTQICIQTTAADASFRDYRPIAVRECVLSTREESKERALDWIERYVGEVMTVDEVERELACG